MGITTVTSITHVWNFAEKAHEGHLDDLDTPYFESHCIHVYNILRVALDHPNSMFSGEKLDVLLQAALLHDTVEDRDVSIETIEAEFGEDVATIVNAVTHTGTKDEFGYWFPRLVVNYEYNELIHMAVILKFADRLSNIIRGGGWSVARLNKYLKRSIFWKTFMLKGSPVLIA